MPPQLALLFCILLILYLFCLDWKKSDGVSSAIWIPFFWLSISGSRTISQWLIPADRAFSANALLEGNPLDRAVFIILIIAGVLILCKRKINWKSLLAENKWVWLYFVFGAISILWSDYPAVSFKRWIKALGSVVVVLVVLTEARPYLAIGVLLRRLAFLLLPLSVLLIKYFPELGRGYHMGQPLFTGVCFTKNALGQVCLLSGIYFSWNLLFGRKIPNCTQHRLHYSTYLIIIPMTVWLLHMANSATSLVCLIVATCVLIVGRHPFLINRPTRILSVGMMSIVVIIVSEYVFDAKSTALQLLGRTPDLTDRADIWSTYLTMVRNTFVGHGFESFYLSMIMQGMVDRRLAAHNGYLEMYLNLGIVGVAFVVGWIISGLKKAYDHLLLNYPEAILRLVIVIVVALYNWTEATFSGVTNMWFLLFFAIMSIPREEQNPLITIKNPNA